jgi:hypothetical protein
MSLSNKARRRIVVAATSEQYGDEIVDAIDYSETVRDTIAQYHDVTGAGAFASRAPGQTAAPIHFGTTLGAVYTPNTHEGYRAFKLSSKFVGNASFHIHWTKSTDANESGKAVRWRISYTITDGTSQDINVAPTVVELEDLYDDGGTTTRIVYRTANTPNLVGAQPSHYLSLKIEAITPNGTPLIADPVLISCDFRYDMYINK